jgi:phosphoglycerate dehydrogenase-like enzyme
VKLLYCGSGWLPIVGIIRERLPAGASIEVWDRGRPLEEAARGAHVLLPSNAAVDAGVIASAAAGELVLIQQPAAGVDCIDLDAARRAGVPVCNAPNANHVAVAEAALLLMLALARQLPRAQRAFAAAEIGTVVGRELRGKTLGVIGLGRSGRALAERAVALGMQVVSVTSRSAAAEWQALYAGADVISLHCPLTPATRGLLDDSAFATIKPGALLVNCARGALIDRTALERALTAGRLGGVGLDTFWEEPWDPADPLYQRDDVVTLPHLGGSTAEAFARIADIVVENATRVATGRAPLHRVA